MVEWKPLLEALAFGTIGAVVLPKIFDWVKRILDLFTGGGASNLLNILQYLCSLELLALKSLLPDTDISTVTLLESFHFQYDITLF